MRQQENFFVGIREDVYTKCNDELKARLGFKVWGVYNYTESTVETPGGLDLSRISREVKAGKSRL